MSDDAFDDDVPDAPAGADAKGSGAIDDAAEPSEIAPTETPTELAVTETVWEVAVTETASEGEPEQVDLAAAETELSADLVRAIEAIVLVATEPVPPTVLAQLLEIPVVTVEALCARLAEAYDDAGHGFQLARVAGGYRFQSHPDLAPYVERFVLEGQTARLSAAALETLAIVAYKQPISRAQIASIRGVDPDGVLRTLQARGVIDQIGRDNGPGQAVLWGTTPLFLEKLGIDTITDLPPLAQFIPGADVVEALEHGLRVPNADERALRNEPIASLLSHSDNGSPHLPAAPVEPPTSGAEPVEPPTSVDAVPDPPLPAELDDVDGHRETDAGDDDEPGAIDDPGV